jgi:hypothetical protein
VNEYIDKTTALSVHPDKFMLMELERTVKKFCSCHPEHKREISKAYIEACGRSPERPINEK